MPPLRSWLRRRAKPVAWVLGVTVLVRISGLASPESKPDNKPGEHQPQYSVTKLALPGASGLVSLDYIVYDHKQHRLWVPAADTGSVDVIDAGNKITRIQGLGTARVEFRGKKRIFGRKATASRVDRFRKGWRRHRIPSRTWALRGSCG
jgi:hypothetical protein